MNNSPSGPTTTDCIVDSPSFPECRTCTRCGEEKPIEDFRIESAKIGKRTTRCRRCYNAAARRYYAERKLHRLETLSAALAQARDLETAQKVAGALLEACGGIDGLTTRWRDYIETVTAEKPGSYRAFRPMFATFNLLLLAEGRPSLHQPTDDMRRRDRDVRAAMRPLSPVDREKAQETAPSFDTMSNAELAELLSKTPRHSGRGRSTAGV